MLYSTVAQIGFVALVVVTLFVLCFAEGWGRLSALLHAANWILVAVFQHHHERHEVFQAADFVIDIIGAILACAIAIAARRSWAAFLAAFQLLGVSNYLIVFFDHRIMHRAFWTLEYVWEAGALVSLVAGGIAGIRIGMARRRAA